ncbi:DUF4384 domain-containing protein [Polynucleobacter sp. AM-25C3]|uniref:DUF4384 domain-containing protein n=1 Tax=Polynucleobacter sp. AM-25C3 TaxID=1855569 RepID=UPI001C0BDB9B|nr:DUF4384 domain-containing protein [Polynucleobacter sp. AM-25C3]MBU3602566.1 DUF4384 domain-containing protein [Polynucleobacter sp. AM-25C3]
MKNIPFRPLLFTFFLTISISSQAAWISGVGEYHFGPDTSEISACSAAEERAKLDALRKFYGESLAMDQTLSCRESSSLDSASDQCTMNQILWSQIGGEIKSSRIIKRDVLEIPGSKVCRVEVVGDISSSRGKPDPGFDVGIKINQSVYRPGEKLTIDLNPNGPMYVAVFNWVPYYDKSKQIIRLFPNSHDAGFFINQKKTIPSSGYSFELTLPDKVPKNRSFVDEYLLAVITKDPVKWLESYSFDEFKSRLAEFPLDRIRYIKRGYQLLIPKY